MDTEVSAFVYKSVGRKSAQRRRGPAVKIEFQSQTFKEARYCVRKRVDPKDVETVDLEDAKGYLVRHFFGIQQALGCGELDTVYWLPGQEDPARSSKEAESNMAPLLRLLQSWSSRAGF